MIYSKHAVKGLGCFIVVLIAGCQSSNGFDTEQRDTEIYTELYDVQMLVDRIFGEQLRVVYADDPFALKLLEQYDLVWSLKSIPPPPLFEPTNPDVKEASKEIHSISEILHWQLLETLEMTVGDPSDWIEGDSEIRPLGGSLIIDTTKENHQQIKRILELMRESRREAIKYFMKEVEAARLLREAEKLRQRGEYRSALELARRAEGTDPNFEPARAMIVVLIESIQKNGAEP